MFYKVVLNLAGLVERKNIHKFVPCHEESKCKEVNTEREMDDFVGLTERLYAGSPYYVPDMETDIRETFAPRKNAGLDFSDIQPFIAYDEHGNAVGRIVGIINHRAIRKWHTKNVRFGFVEFIDDKDVSAALLKAVERWGRERGWIAFKVLWGFLISTRKVCSWRTF